MGDRPEDKAGGQPPESPGDKKRQDREFLSERQSTLRPRDQSDGRALESSGSDGSDGDAEARSEDREAAPYRAGVDRAAKLKELRNRQSKASDADANEEEPEQ